jgi:ABC-type transport system substrate-binding protein
VNISGIHDAAFDRVFDIADHSYDRKVRAANYAAIQKELDQQAYWIGLSFQTFPSTSDSKVLNYAANPVYAPDGWNMYAWKIKGP